MNLSPEQRSWSISIVLHVILLSIISLTWSEKVIKTPDPIVPVQLAIVREAPKPKTSPRAKAKQVPTKKASPAARIVKKPTSLPGDRSEPVLVEKFQPVYPKQALNNDWEGVVKVKAIVSPNGRVTSARVIKSSGFDVLDRAFVRAIKDHYKFKPKRTMGKNKSSSVILSHTFKIGDAT